MRYALLIPLLFVSCTHAQLVTAEQALITCESPAVTAEMANLTTTVEQILTGVAPDWSSQLDALKATQPDAVICLVAQLSGVLAPATAAPGGLPVTVATAQPMNPGAAKIRANAQKYLRAAASK